MYSSLWVLYKVSIWLEIFNNFSRANLWHCLFRFFHRLGTLSTPKAWKLGNIQDGVEFYIIKTDMRIFNFCAVHQFNTKWMGNHTCINSAMLIKMLLLVKSQILLALIFREWACIAPTPLKINVKKILNQFHRETK